MKRIILIIGTMLAGCNIADNTDCSTGGSTSSGAGGSGGGPQCFVDADQCGARPDGSWCQLHRDLSLSQGTCEAGACCDGGEPGSVVSSSSTGVTFCAKDYACSDGQLGAACTAQNGGTCTETGSPGLCCATW